MMPDGTRTVRQGMVVSEDSLASEVGMSILRKGGNAVDAAVAVGFALAVTYPEAGNLGGGGYMLIRMADGESRVIDFREKAPGSATPDMFLDRNGDPVPGLSLHGCLAAGVPGSVAGLLHALKRFGTRPRPEILKPALDYAANGFRVNRHLARVLKESLPEIRDQASSMEVLSRNGVPYAEGDTLRQPDLAGTLGAISRNGPDGFYRGSVASLIVRTMTEGGGRITLKDLESYRPLEHDPLRGSYRGFDILSAGPSSSGGMMLMEILNILERYDLGRYGQNTATSIHLFASAAQRAYADRSKYLGDPDFVSIPSSVLLSKEYAAQRSASIDTLRRTPSVSIRPGSAAGEHHQTTHFCVIDSAGNSVSVTVTLNGLFGDGVVVRGAGFFLNNEMDDFVVKPGVPNVFGLTGGSANAIRPGKRMLSTMTPTIVLFHNRPFLILGGRGGSRIATSVAQVLMNVVDFRQEVSAAVNAPRIHHQWEPDILYFESGIPAGVIGSLKALGYTCELVEHGIARVEAIYIDPESGILHPGLDLRE